MHNRTIILLSTIAVLTILFFTVRAFGTKNGASPSPGSDLICDGNCATCTQECVGNCDGNCNGECNGQCQGSGDCDGDCDNCDGNSMCNLNGNGKGKGNCANSSDPGINSLADLLKLDEAQKTQILALQERFRYETGPLDTEINKKLAEYRTLWTARPVNQPRLEAVATELVNLRRQWVEKAMTYDESLKRLLTPEQQKRWEEANANTSCSGGGCGQGRGNGCQVSGTDI